MKGLATSSSIEALDDAAQRRSELDVLNELRRLLDTTGVDGLVEWTKSAKPDDKAFVMQFVSVTDDGVAIRGRT